MCVTLLFAIGNICMSGMALENGNFSYFKRKRPGICEIRIICYNSLWLFRMGDSNKAPSDFCGFNITHRFLSQMMCPLATCHTHQESRQVEVLLISGGRSETGWIPFPKASCAEGHQGLFSHITSQSRRSATLNSKGQKCKARHGGEVTAP